MGRSRGGFSTKIHVRAGGSGRPLAFVLTPGERHESVAFEELTRKGAVRRPGPGRPKLRPGRLVGDKAYSSGEIRAFLRRRGIRVTIPRRKNERRRGRFDEAAYRLRNRVERLFSRLKQFRRVATRYEKRAENYRAMLTLAAILLWI